jgi:phosphoglycolate phosphatase-like HAD superfamily hydrolase
MEAYIVEYRGEVQPDQEADPLESLDQVRKTQEHTQRLAARLQRRVERLKQDLSVQEKDDPKSLWENMQLQLQEILVRIRSEAEQILHWRDKIEDLTQVYRECHGQAGQAE